MMKNKAIAYYITPHGFGHAMRSLEVIRHILELAPDVEVILVSDIPDFLVEQRVGRPVTYRRRRLDVGLVQLDSVRFDLAGSLAALEALRDRHERIVEEEAAFLSDNGAGGVVADVPFMALYAAARCGLTSIGLGNFTWDWIYRGYAESDPAWEPIIEWIEEGYRQCSLFLQLPMHGSRLVCPRVEDVPLVARRARVDREEARRRLGCCDGRRAFLVSFGSLDLKEEAMERIAGIEGALFYARHPLILPLSNARSADGLDLTYADVVNAMDAVITKPGYGITADCLIHGVPMIYSDRGHFREYEVLVKAIESQLTSVYMPSEDLYSGRWEPAIRRIESLPRRFPQIRDDGAKVCAHRILSELGMA